MAKMPTKYEAVVTLVEEARRDKRRKHSYSSCSIALMCLGLDNVEVTNVLFLMELCDAKGVPLQPSPLSPQRKPS